jgi:uncharacterized protein YbjT (DUF2867 family)
MAEPAKAVIFGATGNVGGAAAQALLDRGWSVRAVTRSPQSDKAQALAQRGAELVQADMDDRASLDAAFDGVDRVVSVQSWMVSGVDGEERQARTVADAAKAAGVRHLVYGSAGIGETDSGVPHFDSKVRVERYMRDDLGLPTTAIRPGPFMELMSQSDFYPQLAAWGVMPKIVGWDTPAPWTAVADIGAAIANALDDPDRWIGRDVNLISDVKSLRGCRSSFKEVTGKKPFGIGLPLFLFNRMAGPEFETMWRWEIEWIQRSGEDALTLMAADSRQICPQAHSVESWLRARTEAASNGQV